MAEENTPAPVEQASQPVASEEPKKDSVSYDTHRKLLAEKKSMQERLLNAEKQLQEFQSAVEAEKQKELEEQNQYKQLYENLKSENEGLKSSISEHQQQFQDALKIDAFNKSLGDRKIDRKYRTFINTKNIMIDPETGHVDELSAQKEVERIVAEFPEIVRAGSARPLPNNAPKGVDSVRKPTMQDRMQILADYLESKRRG